MGVENLPPKSFRMSAILGRRGHHSIAVKTDDDSGTHHKSAILAHEV